MTKHRLIWWKKVSLPALLVVWLLPLHSWAQNAGHNFTVEVTLVGACEAINAGTLKMDFGSYTAFQGIAQNSSEIELLFRCTRGLLPVSVMFDNGSGQGVLQGLHYALSAAPVPAIQPGEGASPDSIGSADVVSYRIRGTMPAHQAGSCPQASCGPATHVRTLMLTY